MRVHLWFETVNNDIMDFDDIEIPCMPAKGDDISMEIDEEGHLLEGTVVNSLFYIDYDDRNVINRPLITIAADDKTTEYMTNHKTKHLIITTDDQ